MTKKEAETNPIGKLFLFVAVCLLFVMGAYALPAVVSVSSDSQYYGLTNVSPIIIQITFNESISDAPAINVSDVPYEVNDCGDSDDTTFCFDYNLTPYIDTPTPYLQENITIFNATSSGGTMDPDYSHSFIVDTVAPVLTEITPIGITNYVGNSSTDYVGAPYIFNSSEAGSAFIYGACDFYPPENYLSWPNLPAGLIIFNLSSGSTDGTYSGCSITVTDAAGNVGELNVTPYTIDRSLPYVVNISSDNQTYSSTTSSPVTIQIDFDKNISSAPSPVISVSPDNDAESVTDCGDSDPTTFCFNYDIPASTSQEETITVSEAQDVAGNIMSSDSNHTFVVDTVPPDVESISSNGLTYNSLSPSTVTMQVNFTKNISNVPSISVSPDAGGSVNDCGDSDNTTFCFNYSIPENTSVPTEEIDVSNAIDMAGNTMSSDYFGNFAIDTVIPFLDTVSISSNNIDTAMANIGDQITLYFMPDSIDLLAIENVTIDGHVVDVFDNGGGSSYSAYYIMNSSDPQGPVNFTIDFTDAYGNPGAEVDSTTDGSSVTFDTNAPSLISINTNTSVFGVGSGYIDLQWNESLSNCTLYVDGVSEGSLYSNLSTGECGMTYPLTINNYPSMNLTMDVTDLAGNNAEWNEKAYLDLCGAPISGNLILQSDITGCTGNGLDVNISDVTIDCAGHSISDVRRGGSNYGIDIENYTGVNVENCDISGFGDGIYMSNSGNPSDFNIVNNSNIHDNVNEGIYADISYATIADTNFTNNGNTSTGLHAVNSFVNLLNGNFINNGDYGIFGETDDSVRWTLTKDAECTNNNISFDGGLAPLGHSIIPKNCGVWINGEELNFSAGEEGLIPLYIDTTADNTNATGGRDAGIETEVHTITGVTGELNVSFYSQNPGGSGFQMAPLGLWIEINPTDDLVNNLDYFILKAYYDKDNIRARGLDENSLRIEYYNDTSGTWTVFNDPYGGVNTTDDYIWANVTHFSIFGIFGGASSSSQVYYGNGRCYTNWTCTSWSSCFNGMQNRTCTYAVPECVNNNPEPVETQSCSISQIMPAVQIQQAPLQVVVAPVPTTNNKVETTTQTNTTEKVQSSNNLGTVFIILLIIVILFLLGRIFYNRGKSKTYKQNQGMYHP